MTRRTKRIALSASQRLPRSVVQLILNFTLYRITSSGRLYLGRMKTRLISLALVNRKWKKAVFEEIKRGWWMFCWRAAGITDSERLLRQIIKQESTRNRRDARLASGGLQITIETDSGKAAQSTKGKWRKEIATIVESARGAQSLLLMVDEEEQLELVRKFPRLRRLGIASSTDSTDRSSKAPFKTSYFSLYRNHPSCTLASFLVRLDLKKMTIVTWDLNLIHLKILTLSNIGFELSTSDPSRNGSLCRSFFSSFPDLRALAIDAIDSTASAAFSLLTSPRLTYLFLGFQTIMFDDSDVELESPLLHTCISHLLRHFRAKITHLTLPPHLPGKWLLYFLLSARDDGSLPVFLRALETVKLTSEEDLLKERYEGRRLQTYELDKEFGPEVDVLCEDFDISPPTYEFWKLDEYGAEVSNWEPVVWY